MGFSWSGFAAGALEGVGQIAKGWIDVEQQTELREAYAEIEAQKQMAIDRHRQQMAQAEEARTGQIVQDNTPSGENLSQAEIARSQAGGLLRAGKFQEGIALQQQADQEDDRDFRYEELASRENYQNRSLDMTERFSAEQKELDRARQRAIEAARNRTGGGGATANTQLNAMKFNSKEWDSASKELERFIVVEDQVQGKSRENLDAFMFSRAEMERLRQQGADPRSAASAVGNKLFLMRKKAEEQVQKNPSISMDQAFSSQVRGVLEFRQRKLQQAQTPTATPGAAPPPLGRTPSGATGSW